MSAIGRSKKVEIVPILESVGRSFKKKGGVIEMLIPLNAKEVSALGYDTEPYEEWYRGYVPALKIIVPRINSEGDL
jgi:hypothetical protein